MSDNPNGLSQDGAEVPPPGSSGNQGFILVVSILGGIFLIALIVMAIYVVEVLPRNRAQQTTLTAQQIQTNTANVLVHTQATSTKPANTATSLPHTATLTNTAVNTATNTPTMVKPTSTSVVAVATQTPGSLPAGVDPKTATVAALLTQAAQAKLTTTVLPTSTALPKTGFAEDIGIPSLLGLTLFLIAVIFLVRRLRSSTTV
jgi:LPXTG-motif cell wall-anchored protein